jgi:hypothetical protein
MLLKFVGDAWYDGKLIFNSGDEVEVSEENGFAGRWIKRGLAVPAIAQPKIEIPQEIKEEVVELAEEPQQDTKKSKNRKRQETLDL